MTTPNRRGTVIVVIFLIAASCIAFGRIAGNGFINYDEMLYVTKNAHIQQGINSASIKWAASAVVASNWHPLTLLSHMLDWSLFGVNASGHHMMSLLLHIVAVVLLFLFLNKATNDLWPSAFAAALFALHPLRVESVAWAAERKDVLSMFFGMASIYAYAFYAQRQKLAPYFLSLIFFALALMSKPMLVTLPFILLLLDYWPLERLQKANAGRLVLEKIPFMLLTAASSMLTFWAQNAGGSLASIERLTFSKRLTNAIISYTAYLEKTFWPFDLAVFYPYDFFLPMWKVFTACAIIILITLVVLFYIRRLPFLFKDSIELWNHVLNVTKDNYVAHNNLAYALVEKGKNQKAIDHYSQAIRLEPNNYDYYNCRANAYITIGKPELAREDYNKAMLDFIIKTDISKILKIKLS